MAQDPDAAGIRVLKKKGYVKKANGIYPSAQGGSAVLRIQNGNAALQLRFSERIPDIHILTHHHLPSQNHSP